MSYSPELWREHRRELLREAQSGRLARGAIKAKRSWRLFEWGFCVALRRGPGFWFGTSTTRTQR